MIRSCLGLLTTFSLACTGSAGPAETPGDSVDVAQGSTIRLQEIAKGLVRPLYLISPPGDRRLFVVEQPGRIRVIENGQLLPTAFLDITSKVRSSGNEQGLLSVAFHPGYASNGLLYVNYTDLNGDTEVERYRIGSDRNRADPASAKRILRVDQPFANHNGGHILFGPDGMLYIGMGDGGSANDPQRNGQNVNALLGKLLRIDVDGGDPYSIPSTNPFVGRSGSRGEIWASGLRNPWRMAFDRAAGQLYIADVGQNQWEEVHIAPAAEAGINYGWNRMEGNHCLQGGSCDRSGLHVPQVEYPHPEGCSIAGGYVYRGRQMPALVGHYFYGDFCAGWIRSFRYSDGRISAERRDHPASAQIMSFGEDSEGELYVLSMNGSVYKIVPG